MRRRVEQSKKALCDGPYILVIACILATAVGVAPIAKPQ